MLPVSLVVRPSGRQEARDVGPERHCGKTARLRGVVVAMRRDCCACVRLRWDLVAMWRDCAAFVKTVIILMVQNSKTAPRR